MNETLLTPSYYPYVTYTIDFTKYATKETLKEYVETLDIVKANKIANLDVYTNYSTNDAANGFKKIKYACGGASGSNGLKPTIIEFKSLNLVSIYISVYIVKNVHFCIWILPPGAKSLYNNRLLMYTRGDDGKGVRSFYDDEGNYQSIIDLANYENMVYENTVKVPTQFSTVDGSIYFGSYKGW